MIPAGQLTGVVLAGGQSRRMGRDKAALVVDGEALWQRQIRVLREAGATTVGVARRSDQPILALDASTPLWLDPVPDAGALAGIHAAFAATPTGWLAVLATDMPVIDAGWFLWLADHCAAGTGAIAQHVGGNFEPLCAIYPREAWDEVNRRLGAAEYRLQDLAQALRQQHRLAAVPLLETETWRVVNWNTPTEAGSG